MAVSLTFSLVIIACLTYIHAFIGGPIGFRAHWQDLRRREQHDKVGFWTQWSEFGLCSVTCGVGAQTRNRVCNSYTNLAGITCEGNATESRLCNLLSICPVDGGWSGWSDYGECNGSGNRYRYRECSEPVPQFGGSACYGSSYASAECNIWRYPVNGGWAEWSCYSICSKACGAGVQYKSRSCIKPPPSHGGYYCNGPGTVERPCNQHNCSHPSGYRQTSNQRVNCSFWMVIQRRINSSANFKADWYHYKTGFGNLRGDYWIGLDKLHNLTRLPKKLMIRLEANDGELRYAEYSHFAVDNEFNKYQLKISGYRGTAGDSLKYNDGMFFSTWDKDNDFVPFYCAQLYSGFWWYRNCSQSHLNGRITKWIGTHNVRSWWKWKPDGGFKEIVMEIADA